MKKAFTILMVASVMMIGHFSQASDAKTVRQDDVQFLNMTLSKEHPVSKLINSQIKKYGEGVNEVDAVSVSKMEIDEVADVTKVNVKFSPYSRGSKKTLACKGVVVIGPETSQYRLTEDSCAL